MVRAVVLSDDASPCTFDELLASARGALRPVDALFRHERNKGIARGLNDGLRMAQDLGAEWLLTIDQDSMPDADLVDRLIDHAVCAERAGLRVGVVAPQSIDDASGGISYPVRMVDGFATTHEVFQSGALWSVSMLESFGGFDESLGIDGVDAAACLSARKTGAVVLLAPDARIEHTWGNARLINVFGSTVAITHHSPERRATMVRNRLSLAPAEFTESPLHAMRTVRRVLVGTTLALTVEQDRWAKARAVVRGLRHRNKR